MKLSLIWIKRQSEVEDEYLSRHLDELKDIDVEKIVVGHTNLVRTDFTYIPFYEFGIDSLGLLCHKKNIGVLAASDGNICVVMHCDVRPHPTFFDEIYKISIDDNTVICPVGEMDDGSAGLTWCLYAGMSKNPLEEFCPRTYISGGCLIASKKLLRRINWNQNLKHNEEEDVDLSRRLSQAGVIQLCFPQIKILMKNSQ